MRRRDVCVYCYPMNHWIVTLLVEHVYYQHLWNLCPMFECHVCDQQGHLTEISQTVDVLDLRVAIATLVNLLVWYYTHVRYHDPIHVWHNLCLVKIYLNDGDQIVSERGHL